MHCGVCFDLVRAEVRDVETACGGGYRPRSLRRCCSRGSLGSMVCVNKSQGASGVY